MAIFDREEDAALAVVARTAFPALAKATRALLARMRLSVVAVNAIHDLVTDGFECPLCEPNEDREHDPTCPLGEALAALEGASR